VFNHIYLFRRIAGHEYPFVLKKLDFNKKEIGENYPARQA
jgi:hypothetical protein